MFVWSPAQWREDRAHLQRQTNAMSQRLSSRRYRVAPFALGFACAAIAAAAVINQSSVHWRENIVDDQLFAYYGWCASEGARPYVDFWDNKPPGIWWLNAAAFRLCGEGVAGEVLLGTFAVVGTLAAYVALARRAFHRSLLLPAAIVAAVLLPDPRLEFGGNRTETYVACCEVLAMLGYVSWLRRRRLGWLVVAGLAAGAAPLFKQSGLAVTAACGLHLLWLQWRETRYRDWRPWAVVGSAWIAAPLAAALALASQGALGEAAFAVGRFNRVYFATGDASWGRLDRAVGIYSPVFTVLTPVFLVAAFGLLWGVWSALRGRGSSGTSGAARAWPRHRALGVVVLWFVLAAYLACVGPGRRGHHFMPALPALGLLVLYPLHLLSVRRGLVARLVASPTSVVLVVVWLVALATLLSSGIAETARAWNAKARWYSADYGVPQTYQLNAAEVRRLTGSQDRVYVWGWSPGTYRWAYRLPATRFATFEKLGQLPGLVRFIFDEATADLQRRPPAVIAISTGDYASLTVEPQSDFAAWLVARYRLVTTVGGMHVLQRLDGGVTGPAAP